MARSRDIAVPKGSSDEQTLVALFRVLTEEQFDYWLDCLNGTVAAVGVDAEPFDRDDRQKTISYWYLLMYLLEVYAAHRNPFTVRKGETWLSDGLVSMEALSHAFQDRYKVETIRRYVFDLKKRGLIALEGRGAEAMVQLSAPAILALADTIRKWVTTFRKLDQRIKTMRVF
jgi:hypothetical protein